jgi:RNA polymerase sigma-70 factor, ECF subfamily
MPTMTVLAEPSDEELMAALRLGQLEALGTIYDRHHRPALALAWRILGDRESAEEIVQEAFLTVWRRARIYQAERGALRGWLLRIVRNRSIDRLRRTIPRGPTAQLNESLADSQAIDTFGAVDQGFARERVVRALASLPPAQRDTINLAYYRGLTHEEIAEQTGTPLGTVKGRIRMAMEKLRLALADLEVAHG